MRLQSSLCLFLFPCIAAAQATYNPGLTEMSFPTVASQVIYGLQNGSPLRSDDAGRTWTPIYPAAPGTPQGVTRIAVQPDNPAVVYAVVPMSRGGVLKSTDSGRTWNAASTGLPSGDAAIESFTISTNQPQTIYARVGTQVYRTVNGGQSWTARGNLPASATAVGFSTQAPATMYTLVLGGSLHRSTDEGATWNRVGAFENDNGRSAVSIQVDPLDTETVYIRTDIVTGSIGRCNAPSGGLLLGRNGGSSLSMIYESNFCNVSPRVFLDSQRPYVHLATGFISSNYCRSTDRGGRFDCFEAPSPIGIDPRNGDIVFGNSGASISRNAGLNWEPSGARVRPSLPAPAAPIVIEVEEGGQGQSSQVFNAVESNGYRMPFTASVAEGAWLTLPATSGTTGVAFRINFSAQGLTPGTYSAALRLQSADAANSPATIPFQLRVNPRIASGLRFTYSRLATTVSTPQFLHRDSAGNIFFYSFSASKIQRLSPSGAISDVLGTGTRASSPDGTPAAQTNLPLLTAFAMDSSGNPYWAESSMVRTIRNGVVATLMSSNDTFGGGNFPVRFGNPRALVFDPQGRLVALATPGIVRRSLTGLLEVVFTTTGQFFTDIAIAPDGTFYLTESSSHRLSRLRQGQLTTLAGTGTAGYNGDSRPAATAQLDRPDAVDVDADGVIYVYESGSRRVRAITADGTIFTVIGGASSSAGNVEGADGTSVQLFADDLLAEPDGSLLVSSSGALLRFRRARGARPEIAPLSMRNAASGGEILAPGSLFSIFGSNFAAANTLVDTAPWPGEVQGLSVLINGRAAPLYFISPNQINGQVPYETATGSATVQVRSSGGSSATVEFEVAARAPGVLQFGENRAVAVNPDGSVNTESAPAPQQSVLVVYFTGTGAVDGPIATGAAATADPLLRPTAPVAVTIGDAQATVHFLGLAPGFVGLGQANIQLPPLPAGTYPLRIAIGEAVSEPAMITIGE